MDDRQIAEHFVVAGLAPATDKQEILEEFNCDGAVLKDDFNLPPITDIGVINTTLGEQCPDDWTIVYETPSGNSANLNLGVFRAPEMYLCYKRGRHQLPLVDIGVLYNGKERVLPDSQIVQFTISGNNSANINTSYTTYLTYRRASPGNECNELIVSDICIKNREPAPHSYCSIEKNVNKGNVVSSEVYLCYRKSVNRHNYISYKPVLLDHYSPCSRTPSFSLPSDLALFCMPMGASLESWPKNTKMPNPVSSTFVLTVTNPQSEALDKVYCAGVTFYERYPTEKLTEEQRVSLKMNDHFNINNILFTNKSICLLSLWPFFDTFEVFLSFLHKMISNGPHSIPIERYVWHLLENVPFPSPRGPQILLELDHQTKVSLSQPEDSPIPLSGAKFRELLFILNPYGCIQLLIFALTEQKVLLHSLRPDVLTAAAEALTMIIFPFHWQCPYIPLCPLGLSSFLNAPIPFLLGLDSRFFDMYHPPHDVICVDLDTGAISIPEDKHPINEKMVPKKPYKILRTTLEKLCNDYLLIEECREIENKKANSSDSMFGNDFKIRKMEQDLEMSIQEAFLTFTASLLSGYSNFLQPIISKHTNPDTSTLFDVDGFVKSRDKSYQKFYHMMVNTQMFSKFIEERSFVSDNDASLAFFDECVERVSLFLTTNEPTGRLLEVERKNGEHTSFLPLPEPPAHVPKGTTWTYDNMFPTLNKSLMSPQSRPTPRLLHPSISSSSHPPSSPMTRRSKQELKTAQRQAVKQAQRPLSWAKYLVSTSYSVWFTQLPSFASTQQHKGRVLQLAYKVLIHMQQIAQNNTDEVCYRIMMQLCGVYSQPVLAVQVLCAMNSLGITPNAITYGYYNRAVLENKWSHSNLYWRKLRNVVRGVSAFRSCGRDNCLRRGGEKIVQGNDFTDSKAVKEGKANKEGMATKEGKETSKEEQQEDGTKTNCDKPSSIVINEDTRPETKEGTANGDLTSGTTGPIPQKGSADAPPSLACVMSSTTLPEFEVSVICCPDDSDFVDTINATQTPELVSCDSSSGLSSYLSPQSSPPHSPPITLPPIPPPLDFTESDNLRVRFGAMIVDTKSSFLQGIQLSRVETHPIVLHSAGLVMTSPLDDIIFEPSRRLRSRPTDLAHALTPTLHNYDLMSETSVPMTCDFTDIRNGPNTGDGKILNRLWTLAYSYMPTSDGSPSSTAENTPKRTPSRRLMGSTAGDKWERSIEKWDNSPKASRLNRKPIEVMDKGHARTDSGSSTGSFIETVKPVDTAVPEKRDPETKEKKLGCESNTQSEESLSDIAEEDSLNQDSKGPRSFFTRNAPDRLSSLFKRGVGVADQKLRGLSKKVIKKSESKDSIGSISSVISSVSSSLTSDKGISPSVSDDSLKNSKIGQSETDHMLFSMKGDQPRLFQSSDSAKRNQSNDVKKSSHVKTAEVPIPVSAVHDKVRLGDPLGALDSPENSPPKATPIATNLVLQSDSSAKNVEKMNIATDSENSSVLCETIYDNDMPISKPSMNENKVLNYDVDIKPSSVKVTKLTPLSVVLINDDEATGTSDSKTVQSPKAIPWSIAPMGGSPFAIPLPVVSNKSPKKTPLKTLPPLPPNTPSKSMRQSRSPVRIQRPADARSNSISNVGELSDENFSAERKRVLAGARTSNSLSSLSSITETGQGAATELAPRQARTLDSSASWSLRTLSDEGGDQAMHGMVLSSLASSGLQKLGNFREHYLDPTMAEFLSTNGGMKKAELLSGGLNSMKSAVTSFSKKLRQTISANNTPTKATGYGWRSFDGSSTQGDDEGSVVDGLLSRRESSLLPSECGALLLTGNDELMLQHTLAASGLLGLMGGTDMSGPSNGQLLDSFIAGPGWDSSGPYCLGVGITSCSKCHNCKTLLYDEEIMAGWDANHSNLNTRCRYCERVTLPELTISTFNVLDQPKDESDTKEVSKDKIYSALARKAQSKDSMTVTYLSPLVLRKELETMLGNEGEGVVTSTNFSKKHPILYWNMMWYFNRLGLPSQLSGLCLENIIEGFKDKIHSSWIKESTSKENVKVNGVEQITTLREESDKEVLSTASTEKASKSTDAVPIDAETVVTAVQGVTAANTAELPSQSNDVVYPDWKNVLVVCLWDNPLYHVEVGTPLYMQWRHRGELSTRVKGLVDQPLVIDENVLQSILTCLHIDDMKSAMKLLLKELQKRPVCLQHVRLPLYRDLLMLAVSALPTKSLNIFSFEKKYRAAYDNFDASVAGLLTPADSAPPLAANLARRYFPPLLL